MCFSKAALHEYKDELLTAPLKQQWGTKVFMEKAVLPEPAREAKLDHVA
jgi:hypothetical protein